MRILFLLLITTAVAWGQGRDFPRWQEEAIVHDLIHGRQMDSVSAHLVKINEDLRVEVKTWKDAEARDQEVIFNYEHDVVPQMQQQKVNEHSEALIYRGEAKKMRRQRNTVIAIFVVVEVIRIICGNP